VLPDLLAAKIIETVHEYKGEVVRELVPDVTALLTTKGKVMS
jgi:hypothetical protein